MTDIPADVLEAAREAIHKGIRGALVDMLLLGASDVQRAQARKDVEADAEAVEILDGLSDLYADQTAREVLDAILADRAAQAERIRELEEALTKIAERVETAVGAGVIEPGPNLYGTRSGHIQHAVFSVIETARRALSREGSEPS